MTHKALLFEVGMEECPARFMPQALADLKRLALEKMEKSRLTFDGVHVYGTPRRFVLYVESVSDRQADFEEEVKGPPAQRAFDAEGEPTQAAIGFAKGQGVETADLIVKDIAEGRYVFALRKEEGQPADSVLPDVLASVVTDMRFPKSMRWGDGELRFVRPIRWLVALFGNDVLPVAVGGIKADRFTHGQRTLAPGPWELHDPTEYVEVLRRDAKVIVDHERRRDLVAQSVRDVAASAGGHVTEDFDRLLDEVTHLVEWPTALVGRFDADYLALPREILVTSMQENQKYFPITDEAGRLLPMFITVRNGDDHALEVVQAGNEKVLAARLADARFFYEEDQKVPLVDKVDQLGAVLFQEKLGSVRDKVERVRKVAADVAGGLSDADMARLDRAALLCKADLVTQAVGEFPELQGVMGRVYALAAGEDAVVADAVLEHYLPRHAQDALPSSRIGTVLAMAEKIDTVVGCFGVGLAPTGSADPYALRRHALGIIRMSLATPDAPRLDALVTSAITQLGDLLADPAQTEKDVYRFFSARLKNMLTDRGWKAGIVDAALAPGVADLRAAEARAAALVQWDGSPVLAEAMAAYERAGNLASKSDGRAVDTDLFQEQAEHALWQSIGQWRPAVQKEVAASRFEKAVETLAAVKPAVDEFFDAVMVMVDDENVRQNRLALLREVARVFESVAQLNLIQV